MLDPIAEMLTIIRNAQKASKEEVVVPASKLKLAIAKLLEREHFIEKVEKMEENGRKILKIKLKYQQISRTEKAPAIKQLRRVSKEGQRIYVKKSQIYHVKGGFGISIISTSRGVMTGKEARKTGLGGEYICDVW